MDIAKRRMFELHAEICKTLSNPKRLEILDHLRESEKSVEELTQLMNMSKSNLSQHLSILRQKRLVKTRRDGLNIIYSIGNPKILNACDILKEVLLGNLTQNQDLLTILQDDQDQDQ
jgi:DNA-binding transcriptional ArsR family regulator